MSSIYERVKIRLDGDENIEDKKIREYIDTVCDRLCIRLNTEHLPKMFHSIAVDAAVKMHRRFYYEGIQSESDGGVSVTLADDVLSEYENEIVSYKNSRKGKVRFL